MRPSAQNVSKLRAITAIESSKRETRRKRLCASRAKKKQEKKHRARIIQKNTDGQAVKHALQDIFRHLSLRARKGKSSHRYRFRAASTVALGVARQLRKYGLSVNYSPEPPLEGHMPQHYLFIQW